MDCEYSTDESLANEITEYLQKDIIMDFDGYEERTYSERFDREDGSHVDIAACARKDAPGIVASGSFILQMVNVLTICMLFHFLNNFVFSRILDMSKLESGEIVLEEIPFNLSSISREVLAVIEQMAAEQNIRIVWEKKEITHRDFIGSPGYVKRVMMNILSILVHKTAEVGIIDSTCLIGCGKIHQTVIQRTCVMQGKPAAGNNIRQSTVFIKKFIN